MVSGGMTPAERRLRAQIASNIRWAFTEDRTAATVQLREGFTRKLENQVDPNRELTDEERAKRVENLRKAHYQRMAQKSAAARRKKRESGK